MSSRWCPENVAGECLQTRFARHSAQLNRLPIREHLNNVQLMVSEEYCEGKFPDTICWTQLRNTRDAGSQTLELHG